MGLRCCARAFSSCGEWGYSSLQCGGFSCCGARALGARASVVAACGLSSCGARASLLRRMGDLPEPGLEPVSPALAGRFLTTAPPGTPRKVSSEQVKARRDGWKRSECCHEAARWRLGLSASSSRPSHSRRPSGISVCGPSGEENSQMKGSAF